MDPNSNLLSPVRQAFTLLMESDNSSHKALRTFQDPETCHTLNPSGPGLLSLCETSLHIINQLHPQL